jgi:hypothetical protein
MMLLHVHSAAQQARVNREILEHFDQHAAFAPARAVRCDPPSHMHERQLDILIGRGIVKPSLNGRYWFDRDALRVEEEQQAATAKKIWLAIAIATLLTLATLVFVGR